MPEQTNEARYILSDGDANANKYWHIYQYDDHSVVTHWGRVGESGQKKPFNHSSEAGADRFFKSKCGEKERKGYKLQRVISGTGSSTLTVAGSDLAAVAKADILKANVDPEVERLIERLSKANVHNILRATAMTFDAIEGVFKTPLGVVDSIGIQEGRGLLGQIAPYVLASDYENPKLMRLISDYLMVIPANIGRQKPNPRVLYPDRAAIEAQEQILESLESALQQVMTGQVVKSAAPGAPPVERVFDLRLHCVDDPSLIKELTDLFLLTLNRNHQCSHLRPKRIYEVELAAMSKGFEEVGRGVGNIHRLWHGTATANLLSILKTGLTCKPPSTTKITAKMFGEGIYGSSQSTKSLNYAHGYWSGQTDDNPFMFMADFALGKPYLAKDPNRESYPVSGYDSTYGKAGSTLSWQGGRLINDENIVYNERQVNLRYLIEFHRP